MVITTPSTAATIPKPGSDEQDQDSRYPQPDQASPGANAPGKAQTSLLLCLAIAGLAKSAALHDGTAKVALGEWRSTQVQHRGRTRGLSEDGYIVRVSAKVLYIRLYPFQSLELVQHAVIP